MNVVNTMVQLSKCPSFPSSTFDTTVRIVNSLAQSLFSTIPCYFIIAMCTVGYRRARWNSSGSLSFLGAAITGCERIPRSPYQNNNKERILTLNEDPLYIGQRASSGDARKGEGSDTRPQWNQPRWI
uniref:Uncharacterized protein n=1 Tax=Trichuris muris TaxID=70415 RepID=A0A5S6Q158_TRIMR